MKRTLFAILAMLAISFADAAAFPLAIMPGDYPDPTIVRDGDDYYMTHSPFYYTPGFLIWHSTDLVNWEPVCRAIPEYEGSAMAPDLIKYDGRFYLYYPAAGTNWVSWADDIRGPWSKPVDLKVSGIDPGHVADDNGNRYLYVNDGEVIRLTPDGLATVGEKQKVYDGWKYPEKWETEGMYLESPKLTYKDGYYYLTSAQGGTAGPATSHMVVSARSRNITGPWENSPYNPAVHTYSDTDGWWSKGHGTLVDDVNGNWWIVYHAYAKGYHTLGRSTLIEPVKWTSEGWWHTVADAELPASASPVADGMELSDDFSGDKLGLQWTFWKENAEKSLAHDGKGLTVKAKGKTPADARLLLVTPQHKNYMTSVDVAPGKGNMAGLLLFYSEKDYAGVLGDGKKFVVYKNSGDKVEVPNTLGDKFMVRIHNRGNKAVMQVSADGKSWTTLADNVDVSGMHHNNYGGFYALRPALCSMGNGSARFSDFTYGDAVPKEEDMGAYLMVFHKDDTHGLHMALSRDGYTFTALNNGDPIMAGDTIAYQKGIRDPHIFRGPDGAFYASMTDLHLFAKRLGYRDTQWERPAEQYEWGNNRGLVLLKSWDLIDWKRTNIRFDTISSAWKEIGCSWAPELTYDESKNRLMLYLTMRHGCEPANLYYAYVNEDFDRIETLPQRLFYYPDETCSAIDGDIVKFGDKYILSYVPQEAEVGIKLAVSDRPDGDWEFSPRWIDFEPKACEAPNVWKRIGEDKWVLMYDVFSIFPSNFGFAETSDFVNFKNLGHFNEGVMKTTNFSSPKHGAVIHLTAEEADRLENYWKENARPYDREALRQK